MINTNNEIPIIGIYKITSPSGKVYIGQSVNIKRREKAYVNEHCSDQPSIYRSIKKYGWKIHLHEIIEQCSLDELNEREVYWKQQELDKVSGDWSKVLFCKLHDNGGGSLSDITKQKISISNKGKQKPPFTEDHKDKISKAKKGWIITQEHRDKISKANKGNTQSLTAINQRVEKNKKPIIQYTLDGIFVKEWDSSLLASISLKINAGNICMNLKGKYKKAGNFIWKYKIS
jgi:group I intron endonuclease